MRKRSLRIFADSRSDKRNFGGERFENQDVVRRDNRRIEFRGGQLAERPVCGPCVHNQEGYIAKQLGMRINRDVRRLELSGIFGGSLLGICPRGHVEQAVFGRARRKEQHTGFYQLVYRSHLLGRNEIGREECQRNHGIDGSVVRKRPGNCIFLRRKIRLAFELKHSTGIVENYFRKIVMYRVRLRVHEMNFGRICIKAGNDKFHQVARAHFCLRRVS